MNITIEDNKTLLSSIFLMAITLLLYFLQLYSEHLPDTEPVYTTSYQTIYDARLLAFAGEPKATKSIKSTMLNQ